MGVRELQSACFGRIGRGCRYPAERRTGAHGKDVICIVPQSGNEIFFRLPMKRIIPPCAVWAMDNAALNAEERQFLLASQDTFYKACKFFGRL